ncbi:ankyrin repeat-containing protein, putative [Ricinus communis]|uniref:Ankyrin repeat-containing protein, putative n=1 Tax=Ricinus communis TaxID=3988 RepID=B9T153_RICCO|nr:ankyrin repeat-containing protein, putative [Ricinus communis]
MDHRLKEAAEIGNVDTLYAPIKENARRLEFAMEIMNLKPSFLIDVDESLVRVKGKGSVTPLHYAAERGNTAVLVEFFEGCPESIMDVSSDGDTALRIAVKNNQVEALKMLNGWIERSAVAELLLIGAHADIRNSEGLTAMDILQDERLYSFRVQIETYKRFDKWNRFFNHFQTPNYTRTTARVKNLTSMLSLFGAFSVDTARRSQGITSDIRSALLVFDALIATVTYQASLSPPGSVWQGTSSVNSPIRMESPVYITTLGADQASPLRYVGTTA